MSAALLAWVCAGIAAGAAQAALTWHSAHRPQPWLAALAVARVLGVGLVLAAAAIAGHLLPAALGWALGLVAGVVTTLRRNGSKATSITPDRHGSSR